MKRWLGTLLVQAADRLPIERLFIKPVDNRKNLKELAGILQESQAKPKEAPQAEPPTEEEESWKLQPRATRVHLVPNSDVISPVTTKETVDYQNRELGKLLLRMERHLAQKLMINGKKCDCGATKHMIDIEGLAEETIPMVDNPEVYYRLLDWVNKVGPKCTVEASASGQYDDDYPHFSADARDFRKELMGTLDTIALFPGKDYHIIAEASPAQGEPV